MMWRSRYRDFLNFFYLHNVADKFNTSFLFYDILYYEKIIRNI